MHVVNAQCPSHVLVVCGVVGAGQGKGGAEAGGGLGQGVAQKGDGLGLVEPGGEGRGEGGMEGGEGKEGMGLAARRGRDGEVAHVPQTAGVAVGKVRVMPV